MEKNVDYRSVLTIIW